MTPDNLGYYFAEQIRGHPANVRFEFRETREKIIRGRLAIPLLHRNDIERYTLNQLVRYSIRASQDNIPRSLGTIDVGIDRFISHDESDLLSRDLHDVLLKMHDKTSRVFRLAELVTCVDIHDISTTLAIRATLSGSKRADRGIRSLMHPEDLWDIAKSLRVAGADNIIHVVMAPRDVIRAEGLNLRCQSFQKEGGVLIPLAGTHKQIIDASYYFFPPNIR